MWIVLVYSSLESFERKKRKEIESTFVSASTENAPEETNVPKIFKNSKNPLFREEVPEPLDEKDLIIKEELRNEEVFEPQLEYELSIVPPSPPVKDEYYKLGLWRTSATKKKKNKNDKLEANEQMLSYLVLGKFVITTILRVILHMLVKCLT